MPKFTYTATNQDGGFVTQRIEAPTLDAARARLEAQGFVSITFREDQLSTALRSKLKETYRQYTDKDPSTAKIGRPVISLWGAIFYSCKKGIVFWGPLLIWNLFSFKEGRPFSIWDWLGFGLMIFFLLFFTWIVIPEIVHKRLLQAFKWHRWTEMRECIRFIRAIKLVGWVPIAKAELDFREASALAFEGKLDRAIALVKRHEGGSQKYTYFSRLSDLYEAGGDYEKMIDCRRTALQHANGSPVAQLYLAAGLLRRQRKTTEAREILKQIEESKLADSQKVFLLYCRFLLAVEQKKWKGSHEIFWSALTAAKAHPNDPVVDGIVHEMNAYMAIATANLGLHEIAREFLQISTPYLKANQHFDLLERAKGCIK
jgi:tetratricopeptide (TPR) repeat protein